jgi:hypothetical protein
MLIRGVKNIYSGEVIMKKVINSIIVLILLLEVRFFYIIKLPKIIEGFNNYNNKMIILIMIIFLISIMIVTNKFRKTKNYKFNTHIWSLSCLICIQLIYSYYKYNQGIKSLILSSYFFFIIFMYYILINFLDDRKEFEKVINTMIIFSLILSIEFLIQGLVYQISGKMFLNISEISDSVGGIYIRNNRLRLTQPSTLISFCVILSYSRFFIAKNKFIKLINLFNIVFGICYLNFVCQTRILLIVVIVSVVSMSIFKSEKSIVKKIMMSILIMSIMIFVLNMDASREFLSSFNSSENSGSVYARKEAIEYYFTIIKQNPINAMGLIYEVTGNYLYYVLHGPQGYLFTTDVGILGLWTMLGTFGLIWYISFIMKIIKLTFGSGKKYNNSINKMENIGVIVFLISTSFTLIITDPQRIILLPFVMVIVEYNHKEIYY